MAGLRAVGAHAYVRIGERLADRLGLAADAPGAALGRLTGTEEQIARLVAEGLSNAQIAERRRIGLKTVETHLNHIYAKLDLYGSDKREQLAKLAGRV